MAVICFALAAFADEVPVLNDRRQEIGKVEYSYDYQPTSRGGCFTKIYLTNKTGEYVTLQVCTNAGGAERVELNPYQENKEVVIGTSSTPTRVYVTGDEARVM